MRGVWFGMKTILLTVLAGTVLAGLVVASETSAGASGPASEVVQGKPAIQKGMTAETVLGLIGKPREVRPIEAEGVQGESWIYRRVAKRVINQVAPTTQKVPAWGGPGVNSKNGEIIDVDVPFMRNERVTIYQMTALLFIDGKLVASKQWHERESLFD